MKLYLAALFLSMSVPTVAKPEGFVFKCCVYGTAFNTAPADPFDVVDGLSGKNSETCLVDNDDLSYADALAIAQGDEGPGGCVSWEELCKGNDGFGSGFDKFVCDPDGTPNPDGVNCCFEGDKGLEDKDNVWTCSSLLGGISTGIELNDKGYMCGPTNGCKGVIGGVCGDPHFQKWDGEWYDFHGECDLVFLEEPAFYNGLGLSIHIRTKARYEYSFIEAAVVKIGDDVLQVNSHGTYFFNGVETAALKHAKFSDIFAISHEVVEEKKSVFSIELPGTQKITLQTFKDLVSVKMTDANTEYFGTSKGLMGDFAEGKMLGRDAVTVMADPVDFGMEWQVTPEEPMLFQTVGVPATEQCRMPSKTAQAERRRLGEGVSQEAAEAACAKVDHINHDSCVYDVMATGDLEVAHAGVF